MKFGFFEVSAGLAACLFPVVAIGLLSMPPIDLHAAESIEAWVVDQQTGKPIEGVVVTASWQSEIHTPRGWIHGEQVMLQEAVTDATGRFRLPAWGPSLSSRGRMDNRAPQLALFKSGYEYKVADNRGDSVQALPVSGTWFRKSVWDGRTIGMKKFSGKLEAYAAHLNGLSSALETPAGLMEGDCNWNRLPLMLRALDAQDTVFRVERVGPLSLAASARAAEKFYLEKGCGSVNELILRRAK